MFIKKNFDGIVPPLSLTSDDVVLILNITRDLSGYISCLEKQKIRDGLKHILNISRLGNGYIQATKPWVLMKGSEEDKYVTPIFISLSHSYSFTHSHTCTHTHTHTLSLSLSLRARAGSTLNLCTNIVCLLSVMLQPYMPQVSREIQRQLQVPSDMSHAVTMMSSPQAPPECNVLLDNFVPFIKAGSKLGEVLHD